MAQDERKWRTATREPGPCYTANLNLSRDPSELLIVRSTNLGCLRSFGARLHRGYPRDMVPRYSGHITVYENSLTLRATSAPLFASVACYHLPLSTRRSFATSRQRSVFDFDDFPFRSLCSKLGVCASPDFFAPLLHFSFMNTDHYFSVKQEA